MTNVLFAASDENWERFETPLRDAFAAAGLDVSLSRNHPETAVDYIVYAPNCDLTDFSPFTNLKAVFSLWAGVERIVSNETLQVPLTRMVDSGLEEGMVEWVTGHVLRHHLGMDKHILATPGQWEPVAPPLARERHVGFLGLGELGAACARALSTLNFPVHGWSRRPKALDFVTCHSGADGLGDLLGQVEILVLLLPDTQQTRNIINEQTLSLIKRGSVIINPGRGTLIDDFALLSALDTGQVAHATLDVFREEPLPRQHPYWAHPQVTVTPHIASETREDTAAGVIAENLRRALAGEPLRFLVDRQSSY